MDKQVQTFRVGGMDCADCALTVENGVKRLQGVELCTVNFATESLRIEGTVPASTVRQRVQELGYSLQEPTTSSQPLPIPSFRRYLWQEKETRLAVMGLVLILPGLLFNELLPMLGWEHPLLNLSSIAAMLLAGFPIMQKAWRAVRINREININVLMTLAAVGALLIGAYTEGGLVMVLFAIGEALEGYTAQRARYAIRSLMEVAPTEATRLSVCHDCQEHLGQDGYMGGICPFCRPSEQRIGVEQLQVGEMILVKPGERIAMDGQIVAGTSSINQAPSTGESQPISKGVGDNVFASSINGEGALTIQITQLAADNTINRIIQMVEEAQERRAPTQRFVDRFARVYTPLVVGIAGLVAILPPLFWGEPLVSAGTPTAGWLYRGLTLLVVACPCALVISTPVSLISAISNAARNGVLIKGGSYLETLAKVQAIAFDKTGTLTNGKPSVVQVQSVNCLGGNDCPNCIELLALATAVEQQSEHPLAQALVNASAQKEGSPRYIAEGVTAVVGKGVKGQVNGQAVMVGSHPYFDQQLPHPSEHCTAVTEASGTGLTAMMVSAGTTYLGYITTADTLRPSSPPAIAELKELGVKHLVMLTGDNEKTARYVAENAGITQLQANLLPAQKVATIETIRQQYGTVAMVGDGINDAPALAAADVGIAMAVSGTAQAIETADIALLADDLHKLPFAIRLSRRTMHIIQTNIGLSIGIKLLFLVAVLAGVGNMWLAVLADVGTSLLVTANGMRLLKNQPSL